MYLFSLTFPLMVYKTADISVSVCTFIITFAMYFTIPEISLIEVTIEKFKLTLPVRDFIVWNDNFNLDDFLFVHIFV